MTSKAISEPIDTEISATIRAPRERDSGSQTSTGRRVARGTGMVIPVTTVELGGRTYHPPTGGREQRIAADHPAVIRRPDLFQLCDDEDTSLAGERFAEARSRAGLSGSARSVGIYGLDFGRPGQAASGMYGLDYE